MNRFGCLMSSLMVGLTVVAAAEAQRVRPVLAFRFDQVDTQPTERYLKGESVEKLHTTVEAISGKPCRIDGYYDLVRGARDGDKALMFDGYTTRLAVPAAEVPAITTGLTVRTTVALGAYPWNWVPLVAQEKTVSRNEQRKKTSWPQTLVPGARQRGWYLGVGPRGQVALMYAVNGQWHQCVSKDYALPLKKWVRIGATFDAKQGAALYLDGQKVQSLKTTGPIDPADVDLVIGMNREPRKQSNPVRPFATLPCWFALDGMIDGVAVWDRALPDEAMARSRPGPFADPPFEPRIMPSGPDTPRPFGAYYAHLKYYTQWDRLWPVSADPDVVIRFDHCPVKVVFWRGTRYSPVWVTENGLWMADQSIENFNNTDGCIEHMLDAHCRFSHVRIIESSPARAVVHWRYCPTAADGNHSQVDPKTGWADWVDEYYYFYPDQVGMRHVVLHTRGRFLWPEEVIGLCQPGQRPEDVVDLSALTLVNLKGKSHTYTWAEKSPVIRKNKNYLDFGSEPADPDDKTYEDADADQPVILMVNLKSKLKPFQVVEPDSWMAIFGIEHRPGVSHFPWWNHWPVAPLPSDGRYCQAPDRAAHFSMAWASPLEHRGPDRTFWWAWMYGMTDQPAESRIPLAASWLHAPAMIVSGDGYRGGDYSFAKRCYTVTATQPDNPATLQLKLAASQQSPVHNLPIVVENFGRRFVRVSVNGQPLSRRDRQYRIGYRHRLDRTDLVLFITTQSTKPMTVELQPVTRRR